MPAQKLPVSQPQSIPFKSYKSDFSGLEASPGTNSFMLYSQLHGIIKHTVFFSNFIFCKENTR
ncbi:MAG TPA: hypothetical protein DCX03_07395 [Bacteroidales bacterium]|nr:hypothetical protein [Bacteroidales bacterium]